MKAEEGCGSSIVWDLQPGDTIRRTDLYQRYGGSPQSGISPSARTPNVLIFMDPDSGEQHGYYDRWEPASGVLLYTGEGQVGDQLLERGNRAILRHGDQGRALRVFKGARGTIEYLGEFEVDDPPYEFRRAPSTRGGPTRDVIMFRLREIKPPQVDDR